AVQVRRASLVGLEGIRGDNFSKSALAGCWGGCCGVAGPGGGNCAPGGGWSCGTGWAIAGRLENTSAPLVTIAQDPRSSFEKLFIAIPLPCDASDRRN